jgi:hypothetical protein
MIKTVSGHTAITSWGSPLLRAARIEGTKITLRTRRSALPLFLNLASNLNENVQELSVKDTWSFNYRAIRMGDSVSDHAGYAIDCWSSTIGAHRWPTKMPAKLAREISNILETYKTPNGKHIFLWGASSLAPGVIYTGPTHKTQAGNDPMHFAIAKGITTTDLMKTRKHLGIKLNGTTK